MSPRRIHGQPSGLPLIPAPVALVQELVLEEPRHEKVEEILSSYPPDELRVMAAQFLEMAELVNDYADRRGVRHG